MTGNGKANLSDDAQGVVQDAFVKAYYKLKDFRFGSNFYSWFYRLLVNQAIDRWRKASRSPTVSFDDAQVSGETSEPEAMVYPKTPEEMAGKRELGEGVPPGARGRPEQRPAGEGEEVRPPLRACDPCAAEDADLTRVGDLLRLWSAARVGEREPQLSALWTRVRAGIGQQRSPWYAPLLPRGFFVPAATALAVLIHLFYPYDETRAAFPPKG